MVTCKSSQDMCNFSQWSHKTRRAGGVGPPILRSRRGAPRRGFTQRPYPDLAPERSLKARSPHDEEGEPSVEGSMQDDAPPRGRQLGESAT